MEEPIPDGYLEIGLIGVDHSISYTRYYFRHMRSWTRHQHGFGVIIRIKPEALKEPSLGYKANLIFIPWSSIHQLRVIYNTPEVVEALNTWEKLDYDIENP